MRLTVDYRWHIVTTPRNSSTEIKNKVNKGGRPKKRKGNTTNGGRPKKARGEPISVHLERKIARNLLDEFDQEHNDPLILNRVGKLIFARQQSEEGEIELKSDPQVLGKDTKELASAFFLEYNYTKRSYSALVRDINIRNGQNRKLNFYPSYAALGGEKKECHPKKLRILNEKCLLHYKKWLIRLLKNYVSP
ncbi:hypothetical protein QAD02_008476 [Eretmocerus hayati]|uniref:Uncharacterized protein n=1 Tax=Eretmocerus hayati TaxID=131215 RepID=A0ACC2N904_9HYME|nr:hypothetical protein QAD02_008476 [Eretmocerus hayati]